MTDKNAKMFLFFLKRTGTFDNCYLGLGSYLGFGACDLVFKGCSGEVLASEYYLFQAINITIVSRIMAATLPINHQLVLVGWDTLVVSNSPLRPATST